MEILQEIGSYAGFAAVIGLAVLSALYFSQARDVKRLREWAGRAPERAPTPVEPRRVIAQPVPKPPQPAGGQAPPPVPRPPGAQPGAMPQPAAAQSAAGATPAVAKGPAAATPAAQAAGASPGSSETDEDEPTGTEGDAAPEATEGGDAVNGGDVANVAEAEPEEGDAAIEGDADAGSEPGAEDAESEAGLDEGDGYDEDVSDDLAAPSPVHQETDEWDPVESGEWRPEDEHSDLDSPERGAGAPASSRAVSPPVPPQPFRPSPARPRRPPRSGPRGPAGPGRDQILPPYSQSRPQAAPSRDGDGRRTAVTVGGIVLALAIAVFAVVQVTGDDESSSPLRDAPQSAPSDVDGAEQQAPVDPSTVTVAVLNGTTVPGLAAQMGDKLRAQEFQVGTVTNNYNQELAESVVLYAPGAEREAADVARRLDIPQREPVDPDSQGLAGDASVVVVTGADLNQ